MNTYIKFIIFIICSIPKLSFGQGIDIWRAGSAFKLDSSVYTLSCFVSDSSESWKEDEKKEILKKLEVSTEWLTEQATKFNVDLNFENHYLGLNKDIKLQQIDRGTGTGNERVDLVSIILSQIGSKKTIDFYNWVIANIKCKNVLVLVFAKGKGTSYSMAYSTEMNRDMFFVEGAILYEKYWNSYPLAPSSIAHEILHLFGAWDLYKTYAQTKENENMARKLFPNSIMHRTSYNIEELNVDELTAWLIGWSNSRKEWYEKFRPNNSQQ